MAAGTRLSCQTCHEKFTRPIGSNRLNCFTCRPERGKKPNWAQIAQFPGPNTTGYSNAQDGPNSAGNGENSGNSAEFAPIEGDLTRFSRLQLEEWGVLATYQGAAAMALARLIDEGKGGGSGGAASAVKAHHEAMMRARDIAVIEKEDKVTSIFSKKA